METVSGFAQLLIMIITNGSRCFSEYSPGVRHCIIPSQYLTLTSIYLIDIKQHCSCPPYKATWKRKHFQLDSQASLSTWPFFCFEREFLCGSHTSGIYILDVCQTPFSTKQKPAGEEWGLEWCHQDGAKPELFVHGRKKQEPDFVTNQVGFSSSISPVTKSIFWFDLFNFWIYV